MVYGIRALPVSSASGLSFHLHNEYIVVMSMTHLVMLSDPTQIEGNNKGSSLPLVGQTLNCGKTVGSGRLITVQTAHVVKRCGFGQSLFERGMAKAQKELS